MSYILEGNIVRTIFKLGLYSNQDSNKVSCLWIRTLFESGLNMSQASIREYFKKNSWKKSPSNLNSCFAMTRLHEQNSSGFVLHAVSIDDSSMVIGNDWEAPRSGSISRRLTATSRKRPARWSINNPFSTLGLPQHSLFKVTKTLRGCQFTML